MLQHSLSIDHTNWSRVRHDLKLLLDAVQLQGEWINGYNQIYPINPSWYDALDASYREGNRFNGILKYRGLSDVPRIGEIVINDKLKRLDKIANDAVNWVKEGLVVSGSISLDHPAKNRYRLIFRFYDNMYSRVRERLNGQGHTVRHAGFTETYLDNSELVRSLKIYIDDIKNRLQPNYSLRMTVNDLAYWIHYVSRESDVRAVVDKISQGDRFAFLGITHHETH